MGCVGGGRKKPIFRRAANLRVVGVTCPDRLVIATAGHFAEVGVASTVVKCMESQLL
jgi:hypothetical protein